MRLDAWAGKELRNWKEDGKGERSSARAFPIYIATIHLFLVWLLLHRVEGREEEGIRDDNTNRIGREEGERKEEVKERGDKRSKGTMGEGDNARKEIREHFPSHHRTLQM